MRRLTVLLMLLCTTAAVGACGGDEEADRPDKPAPRERPTLTECLEDADLEVERDGDVTRATDPESDAEAEITAFPTGAAASEFANGLEPPGTQAGTLVANYFSSDNPTQVDVDRCISAPG